MRLGERGGDCRELGTLSGREKLQPSICLMAHGLLGTLSHGCLLHGKRKRGSAGELDPWLDQASVCPSLRSPHDSFPVAQGAEAGRALHLALPWELTSAVVEAASDQKMCLLA